MGICRLTSMWRFTLARATGTSHIRSNLPCQDRCVGVALPDGVMIAALADGAGSAQFADEGAEIAINEVVASLSAITFDPTTDFAQVIKTAATGARDAVQRRADELNANPREFASTLLAIVSTPHGGGAAQIGDGVIVVNQGDADWCWVFWPQRGEYANTTRFLTDPDALDWLQTDSFPEELSDLALTSDGLESLVIHYASRSVHAPFFAGMFDPLVKADGIGRQEALSAALEDFLGSHVISDRTDDDVSLVLATRRPSPAVL